MKLKILFFGIASDIVQTTEIDIHLQESTTVFDCKMALQTQFPNLKNLNSYAIAVNEIYADNELVLKSADVVAIIPPVSGG
jgi:molybdopterin converting factor subunit 1